jgi:hypothetical protein
MIPFSYAIIDDEGEVIRKHRWSVKEAKWFTENNPSVKVVKLEVVKETKEDIFNSAFKLVGECLF